jgi:hypothetical protein
LGERRCRRSGRIEYPIARLYADARVQKIYAGSNEIMKMLIARTLWRASETAWERCDDQ